LKEKSNELASNKGNKGRLTRLALSSRNRRENEISPGEVRHGERILMKDHFANYLEFIFSIVEKIPHPDIRILVTRVGIFFIYLYTLIDLLDQSKFR
jgi:hypothetical protein